jgi:hypothetical protein
VDFITNTLGERREQPGRINRRDNVEVELNPVDFAPPVPPVQLGSSFPAEQVMLLTLPPGFQGDWHPVPRRQLYFQLSGEIEVAVSAAKLACSEPEPSFLERTCPARAM